MSTQPEDLPSPPPTVAAFDLDGTVTRGGSTLPFLLWAAGVRRVALAGLRTLPAMVHGAIAGGPAADRAKEALFTRLLAGMPADRLEQVGHAFAERHLHQRARPQVLARMDWHRQQGHALVLVSASTEAYVRPIGRLLGTDAAIGTRLAVDGGGRLTGRYEGRNCRGGEKYARLAAWIRTSGLVVPGAPQPTLWAYGNSRGDLRLLEAADHGVDAGLLRRLGRLRHYPTLAQVLTEAERPARAAPSRPATGPRQPPRPPVG